MPDFCSDSTDGVAGHVRRIHIVGGPGTGKSTLAARLGKALNIDVHSLDAIAYEGPDFRERLLPDRLADVNDLALKPEWIVEGVHVDWITPLFRQAELIIWLDHMGWTTSALRILRRFTKSALATARRHRGAARFARFRDYRRHLIQLVHVLLITRQYYRSSGDGHGSPATRGETEGALGSYRAKVVRCSSSADVERIVADLTGV